MAAVIGLLIAYVLISVLFGLLSVLEESGVFGFFSRLFEDTVNFLLLSAVFFFVSFLWSIFVFHPVVNFFNISTFTLFDQKCLHFIHGNCVIHNLSLSFSLLLSCFIFILYVSLRNIMGMDINLRKVFFLLSPIPCVFIFWIVGFPSDIQQIVPN